MDRIEELVSEEEFVELCQDYDKKAARECLRSSRKYKRSCEVEDIDLDACGRVCGRETFPRMTSRMKTRSTLCSRRKLTQSMQSMMTDLGCR